MIVPKTKVKQQAVSELDDDELDEVDEYQFYGIIQRPGLVHPVNIDHAIYYSHMSVINAPNPTGLEINLDHVTQGPSVGEVVDKARHQGDLFALNELRREDFEEFAEYVEEENGNIGLTFNQLVREIDAGNLALSAGLRTATATTPIHEYTVTQIMDWQEVSVVGAPASPGSWAWPCDGVCDMVFGEQSMEQLDINLETLEQSSEKDELPSQIVDTLESDEAYAVQVSSDGEVAVIEDESELVEQGSCGCGGADVDQLKEELESVKQERDQYKEVIDEIEQSQRDDAEERLREVNQSLPEDRQKGEEEIEDLVQEASLDHLEQTIDMMEGMVETTQTSLEQGKEDLGGSGGSTEPNNEEAVEQVNSVTQSMLGRPADEVFEDIEQGDFGN